MSKTKKIILVWVVVGIVIAGTLVYSFVFYNPYPDDKITFNVLAQKTATQTDYAHEDLATEDYKLFGVDPTPMGVPSDILFQGYILCTPKASDGTLISNQRAIFSQFNNYQNQNRRVYGLMSETDTLLINSNVSELNRGLDNTDDVWSVINDIDVKLYKFDNDELDPTLFAHMILNGHFWRIEGHHVTEKEFVHIIRSTIFAYK